MAMPAAMLTVAAALYGLSVFLVPDHTSYCQRHKRAYNDSYNKSPHHYLLLDYKIVFNIHSILQEPSLSDQHSMSCFLYMDEPEDR